MIIKWEIGNFNGTCAAIDGRRKPIHSSIAADQDVGIVSHIKLAINAGENEEKKRKS